MILTPAWGPQKLLFWEVNINLCKGKSIFNSKDNTWMFSELRNCCLIVISILNIFIKIFFYLYIFKWVSEIRGAENNNYLPFTQVNNWTFWPQWKWTCFHYIFNTWEAKWWELTKHFLSKLRQNYSCIYQQQFQLILMFHM